MLLLKNWPVSSFLKACAWKYRIESVSASVSASNTGHFKPFTKCMCIVFSCFICSASDHKNALELLSGFLVLYTHTPQNRNIRQQKEPRWNGLERIRPNERIDHYYIFIIKSYDQFLPLLCYWKAWHGPYFTYSSEILFSHFLETKHLIHNVISFRLECSCS